MADHHTDVVIDGRVCEVDERAWTYNRAQVEDAMRYETVTYLED